MCLEKKEEMNLPPFKMAFDAALQRLVDYIEKHGGKLLRATIKQNWEEK